MAQWTQALITFVQLRWMRQLVNSSLHYPLFTPTFSSIDRRNKILLRLEESQGLIHKIISEYSHPYLGFFSCQTKRIEPTLFKTRRYKNRKKELKRYLKKLTANFKAINSLGG